MSERQVLAILLGISLLFACLSAFAGSITIPNVCQPSRYVQRGKDLLIYCPWQAAPRITVKECRNARVMWNKPAGRVTVTCRN
jgi:hypothetical protein